LADESVRVAVLTSYGTGQKRLHREDFRMGGRGLGIGLAAAGAALLLLGALIWSGALSWFGRLPGDIRLEREGFRVYVPLVSMLLVSIVVSLLLWLLRRLS
jgi:hypothetical protein